MLIPPYYAASGGEYTQKRLKLKTIDKQDLVFIDESGIEDIA
ncbi:hypothetical protein [Rickettsia endosymbiont of Gonocerus acuteangulatus]